MGDMPAIPFEAITRPSNQPFTTEQTMKLETIKTPTTEVYVQHGDTTIAVTQWGNLEGANIMVTGKDLALRMACAMTWEEIAALQVALAAANS